MNNNYNFTPAQQDDVTLSYGNESVEVKGPDAKVLTWTIIGLVAVFGVAMIAKYAK